MLPDPTLTPADPNPTKLPLDWPPAVEESQTWAAVAATYIGGSKDAALARYRLLVICDLVTPSAHDFWLRKLAEKVGLTVGATAPSWFCQDYGDGPFWTLATAGSEWMAFSHAWPAWQESECRHAVEAMRGITDPTAALRAALLATFAEASDDR